MRGTVQGTIYGHELISPIPMGWLDHEAPHDRPVHVSIKDTHAYEVLPVRHLPPGTPRETRFSVQALPDGRIVAEVSVLGAFVLDPESLQITAPDPSGHDHSHWEHTLYSWAIPLLLAASGRLVVHGAAIETPAGALIVVGPSTRGKTSFAAAAVQAGYRLLGEDGIAIKLQSGVPVAYPGCLGVRLRHDSNGNPRAKVTTPIPQELRCSEPRRVAAVVALRERTTEGTAPTRCGAAVAVSALRMHAFSASESLAGLYPTMAAVARAVPIATASLRDGLRYLPDEVERLVNWVSDTQISAAA
jgi:hypothetical protein